MLNYQSCALQIKSNWNLAELNPEHLFQEMLEIRNFKWNVRSSILCWFVFILPQGCKKENAAG